PAAPLRSSFAAGRPCSPAGPLAVVPAAAVPASPAAAATVAMVPLLLAVWCAGSLLFLVFVTAGLFRGRRRTRALAAAPAWLTAEVTLLATRLGVRPPRLVVDDAAAAPFLWSCLSTVLVVPATSLQAAGACGRTAVLAHELAHLRRRDHWLARLELLLAALLWWQPLFWFARARMREQAELACDAWAMWAVPDGRLAYADVLIAAVAHSASAASPLAVLAARPSARAAFERRLVMILNERVPFRLSRWSLLPFAALALALVSAPVAAQGEGREPAKVEIKVNGKSVQRLSAAERHALLQQLLQQAEAEESAAEPAPAPKAKAKKKIAPRPRVDAGDDADAVAPAIGDVRGMLRGALQEARSEVVHDHDLQELGIADDVVNLIDTIADGGDFQGSLQQVIRGAMHGAGEMAIKEIRADPDLRRLGIGDSVEKLVRGLLQNEQLQGMVMDVAQQAMKSALREAKVEVRGDRDLQELGIADDVAGLLDSLDGKGDFNGSLQRVIDKAIKAAGKQAGARMQRHGDDDETEVEEARPAPKPKAKSKKKPKDDGLEIR
ncbi:MAG TPA: M56 family metallopeptidase, partial [Planctomycetota bacterium]|nr:M56 family metallopeptidase [Planctomycetota bacterium]